MSTASQPSISRPLDFGDGTEAGGDPIGAYRSILLDLDGAHSYVLRTIGNAAELARLVTAGRAELPMPLEEGVAALLDHLSRLRGLAEQGILALSRPTARAEGEHAVVVQQWTFNLEHLDAEDA